MLDYRLPFLPLLVLLPAYLSAQSPTATEAVLEGDVVNSVTGAPVSGARIKLDSIAAEPLYGKADASGRFFFASTPRGRYQLSVEAPGYLKPPSTGVRLLPPQPAHTVREFRTGTPTVEAAFDANGILRAKVSLSLTPYAVIAGRVTDPDGEPMHDESVEILQRRPVNTGDRRPDSKPLPDGRNEIVPTRTVRTDDKGEFRVARLEAGAWYIVANKAGFPGVWDSTYRITYYPRSLDLASAKPLELAAGQQARADIQIIRQAGVNVTGHLILPAGEKSSHFLYTNIVLVPEHNYLINANGPFTTGREDYTFPDVLPGKYTLMAVTRDASADPLGGNQTAIYGLQQPIEVADRDMNGVDLALQPLRDLNGTVVFTERCTPGPVHIAANTWTALGPGVDTVSDADGRFVLRGLGPGQVRISVSRPGEVVRIASIRLGDRDVAKDGFASPLAGDDSLRIEIGCGNARVQR